VPDHWVPYILKAKLGIALKQLGCRLIHGPRHFYGPLVEGELRRHCRSCGKGEPGGWHAAEVLPAAVRGDARRSAVELPDWELEMLRRERDARHAADDSGEREV
jgi:hypothetical protein